jgi:HKD family nuclease
VGFEARLAELENLRGAPDSFHPKAWRIADASGGIVVVGSSNLSRAALETGVEWNLVIESAASDCLEARGASFDVALPVIRRQKAGLGKKAGLLYD